MTNAIDPGQFAIVPLQELFSSPTNLQKKPADYNGAELQPYQGRPGSLDFLALPSLMGTRRVYRADHKPKSEQV